MTPPTESPTGLFTSSGHASPTHDSSPPTTRKGNKIRRQAQRAALADGSGEPDLAVFTEPVLVINQKGKLVELRAEYAIYNRDGLQLAAVRGRHLSSRIQVVDMHGRSLLDMRRESSLVSSRVIVTRGNGEKVGRIVPSRSWNQVDRDFKLEGVNNEQIGAVFAEDRQRHREFNVQDASGNVVAHVSKTRAGLAKELFTKGDHYVVEFPRASSDQLRALSIATALVIDTRFHQR
jgi:uncharacterized protein YxjI